MVLTEQQRKEFETAVRPLMAFLGDYHPHVKVVVDSVSAEFVEGVVMFRTEDYIKD